jgi:hypothetical protein
MLDGDLFLKGGAQMKDQLTPKPGTPSADELFELAYNYRYHEALLGFLLMQGAGDTLACDNLYTLHGVIRGAYLQIMTGEGVTGIVRDAIMNAAGTAYEMLKSLVERDGVPHEYYRAAHMWGGMLERCGRAEEALAVVEEAFDHDVSGMPYMKNALTLLRLRLLQSGGRVAEAHALAASMALRPFLISDATHLAELSHQYGRLCREVGRLADFDRVMWRGLRVTRGNSSLRQRSLELLVDLYGGIEPLLARAGTASIERVVTMLAWSNRFLTGDRQGCRLDRCFAGSEELSGPARAARVLFQCAGAPPRRRVPDPDHPRHGRDRRSADDDARSQSPERGPPGQGNRIRNPPGTHAAVGRQSSLRRNGYP